MSKIKAEIVADSISPQGHRLTSLLITFPRIILAEVNTHRMLSKNTSSSRAIPFNKMIEAVQNDPFIPIAWQKEHKGMQGTEYLTDTKYLISCWLDARTKAVENATNLTEMHATKQLANRLLEPFMWTTMLITGSEEGWNNLFSLRCPQYSIITEKTFKSKKELLKDLQGIDVGLNTDLDWLKINKGQAEVHMMALAEAMWDAYNESTPKQLQAGEWHIPFEGKIDLQDWYNNNKRPTAAFWNELEGYEMDKYKVKISSAMAAHTSYTTVGNEPVKSYEKWIELHDRLIAYQPPHSSPLEHCARAMSDTEYDNFIKGQIDTDVEDEDGLGNILAWTDYRNTKGWCRNFRGFIQYRHIIEKQYENNNKK